MDLIGLLNYLGITHDRVLPFLILVGAMFYVSYWFTGPIKKSISGLTRAILEIQVVFKNNGVPLIHNLVEGPGSPTQPTQFGKSLIVESGLEKILDDNREYLKTELAKQLPEKYTEYDVQEKARTLLIELKNNDIMNPVKKYAYENGSNVDIILKVGGLWLRDDFLGKARKVLPDNKNEIV